MAIHNFELSASGGVPANVEGMTTTPNMAPRSQYLLSAESVRCADGNDKARGFAVAVWTWGFVPTDLFAALRAICAGSSASVKIRTLKEDYSTYAYYTAIMHWPPADGYEYRAGVYRPFELRFTHLVAYTP